MGMFRIIESRKRRGDYVKKNNMKKKVLQTVLATSLVIPGLMVAANPASATEQIAINESFNTPSYLIGSWKAPKSLSQEDAVYAFLQSKVVEQKKKMSGKENLNAAKEQFTIIDKFLDQQTNTYHFKAIELYNGVPIYGSEQAISLTNDHEVKTYFGQVTNAKNTRVQASTKASISEKDAVAIAQKDIEKKIGEVKQFDGLNAKQVMYEHEGTLQLVYAIQASTSSPAPGYFHYFVSAQDGKVLDHYDAFHGVAIQVEEGRENSFSKDGGQAVTQVDEKAIPENTEAVTSRGIDIFGKMHQFQSVLDQETGERYMFDGSREADIQTFEASRMGETVFIIMSGLLGFTGFEVTTPTSVFYDPAAVSAHINAGKVHDHYQKKHDRNSMDDKGMKMISTVHVGDKWNNAGWNGKQMLYGDGDGKMMISTSGSLDVIGHEMTHGVIENTAGLIYKNESGAINESIADIMGAFIENKTGDDLWLLGEDIYTPAIDGDGLRDMKDPASVYIGGYTESGYYPDHYDDRYIGELDNGGVHVNSSINNKAAYLLTEGDTHNDVTVVGIGKDKAEKIYYRALTHYLTASSDFSQMRQAAIQAASDLYPEKNGEPSQEVQSVMAAYDAVGVF